MLNLAIGCEKRTQLPGLINGYLLLAATLPLLAEQAPQ
jgi:hypothetical protein